MRTIHRVVPALLCAGAPTLALAQEAALPPVTIDTSTSPDLARGAIRKQQGSTSDTASLLTVYPGVAINTGGGPSGMPVIHGLSEQRLNVLVDGRPIDSACPNDMNTPLSYTDPQTVASIRVINGVAPVSLGGDSIGAAIAVDGPAPRFTAGGVQVHGEVSGFYRSNDGATGTGATLTVAGKALSATYTGSFVSSGRYHGGGALGVVRSSEYRKTDHALALASHGAFGLVEIKAGYHHAPYEGFPNQYMDMTDNTSWFVNGHWHDDFAWGSLDARADWRAVDHEMNFLADKGGSADGGMPMNTRVRAGGYTLKAEVPLGKGQTLRAGHEYHRESLNDWWPPVAGSMMMGPNPFLNIADGVRSRIAGYGEIASQWTPALSTVVGARVDRVVTNAGQVQPYGTGMMNMADAMAAMAFNAVGHRRVDTNWSGSALASYSPVPGVVAELGYAHKARSPNLYERYAWGRGAMSSSMIGWYGDGNGYVGNLDLKPERADTISLSLSAGGGTDAQGGQAWSARIAPWYTHVNNYVDARFVKAMTDMMGMPNGFVQLQFANVAAQLYGLDLSGAAQLRDWGKAGATRLSVSLAWLHGENRTTRTPLYHQQPFTATVALTHRIGGFEAGLDGTAVARKTRVDPLRNEPVTPAYALLGAHAAMTVKGWRVAVDATNLLDKAYSLPLGGQSLGDYAATGTLRPVPGRGRSVDVSLSRRF